MKILVFVLFVSFVITQTYDSSFAHHQIYMSKIAYSTTSQISSWGCDYCSKFPLTNVKVFDDKKSKVQGFTGYSAQHKTIIVSFRGSANINNWFLNLATLQTSYSKCNGCKVHLGFYASYKSVRGDVAEQVKVLKNLFNNASVSITGHSQGGALALLLALDLYQTYSLGAVYTFGQPRVGNDKFANYCSDKIDVFRIVHDKDIVPHVPGKDLAFHHGNTQIWYNDEMTSYHRCEGDSSKCSNKTFFIFLNIKDHEIKHYLKLKVQNSANHMQKNEIHQAMSA